MSKVTKPKAGVKHINEYIDGFERLAKLATHTKMHLEDINRQCEMVKNQMPKYTIWTGIPHEQ